MPWKITLPRVTLPAGYRLVGFWDSAASMPYLLVYCTATGRWVSKGRRYTDERQARVAAQRSAWMLRYNAACRAA